MVLCFHLITAPAFDEAAPKNKFENLPSGVIIEIPVSVLSSTISPSALGLAVTAPAVPLNICSLPSGAFVPTPNLFSVSSQNKFVLSSFISRLESKNNIDPTVFPNNLIF